MNNKPQKKLYWLSAASCVLILVLFWKGYGYEWGRLYSPSPFHRLEVAALLNGHFELSRSIENIDWDCAWYNGAVNHVWGLGTALWMLPFEVLYRMLGKSCLPDRIPLLVAIALFAWYATRGGWVVARKFQSSIAGILFAYLVLFCPAFWNLTLGYKLVYEETLFYALILSLAVLIGTVRFLLFEKWVDFWIVCCLAGLSSLVRPTHGIYGLLAAAICGCAALFEAKTCKIGSCKGCIAKVSAGWSLTIIGFAFLAYSNYVRFGSPTEFGHRLTVTGDMIIYATRYDNPFATVSLVSAGKELFSWIFLSPFHRPDSSWCSPNAMPWQSPVTRWRDVYQPTFDPSYLLICLVGISIGLVFLIKRVRRSRSKVAIMQSPLQRLTVGLLLWSFIALVGLGAFYLYFPTISSRYILDFAPALLAPFLIAFVFEARKRPYLAVLICLLWIMGEATGLLMHRNILAWDRQFPRNWEDRVELPSAKGEKIAEFKGEYTVARHPSATAIVENGAGWFRDGMAKSMVTVMIDRPEFIEVSIGEQQAQLKRPLASGVYRAKINNFELLLESIVPSMDGTNKVTKVRFSIPKEVRAMDSIQVASVCFTHSIEEADLMSLRPLLKIRWR